MRKLILILSVICTVGCTHYAPRSSHPLAYYNRQVNTEFSTGQWYLNYNKSPSITERNRLTREVLLTIDKNYDRFEIAFYTGKAKEDIAGDFLGLALGGTSTLLTNAATKSILALVASGIVGGKASLDAHWYDMQTREAIVSQMRALRNSQLLMIEQGLNQPLANYSLDQALTDAQAYFQAGSVVDALQAIAQNASSQAVSSKQLLKQVRVPVR